MGYSSRVSKKILIQKQESPIEQVKKKYASVFMTFYKKHVSDIYFIGEHIFTSNELLTKIKLQEGSNSISDPHFIVFKNVYLTMMATKEKVYAYKITYEPLSESEFE